MEASGNGPIDHDQWQMWLEWMEKNKLSWVVWSVSDKNETCSMMLPAASSNGGWGADDLREWGNLSRKSIKELNNPYVIAHAGDVF